MVLVRVEDREGAVGWGEIWCNFPSVGAEHRARLLDQVLAPLVEGHQGDAAEIFGLLSQRLAVLALQSGEPGPVAQCIAGLDMALWDLVARRANVPLWRMLGGTDPEITVYASGLNPDAPERLAAARWAEGYRAFKLKIGFGAERDLANLRALRDLLGDEPALMVDANQAWSLEQALREAPALDRFGLRWLEEPLRADRDWAEWRDLAMRLGTPLAAGENIAGEAAFAAATDSAALRVVQPDLGKWGGFSGTVPVVRRIVERNKLFCPHWLGGGIGLLASAHLLAAMGGGGMLEIDANPNPLRKLICGPLNRITEGRARLTDDPGLGEPPNLDALRPYYVSHHV
jgi:D-galactarolactone cycloisomerase